MSPRGGGAARTSGLPGYASNDPKFSNGSSSIGGDGSNSGRVAPTAGILPPVNFDAGSSYGEVDAADFSLGLGALIFGSSPRRPAGIVQEQDDDWWETPVSTTWSTSKPRASASAPNPQRPTRVGQGRDNDSPNMIEQEQNNGWWDTPVDTTWPTFDSKLSSNPPFDANYWSSSSVNTAPRTAAQTPIAHVTPTATGVAFPAVEESAAVRSAGINLLFLACLLGLVARRV